MKKILISTTFAAITVLIAACSSTPKPAAVAQIPAYEKMQSKAGDARKAGGLAVVGLGESKDLDLAIRKAKANARQELAQMINIKVESLEKFFLEETGQAATAEILSQFSSTAKILTSQELSGSTVEEVKTEKTGGTVTAFVLMSLDPQVIADQLAKQKELYTRFRSSEAFKELDSEIKRYDEWKKLQGL